MIGSTPRKAVANFLEPLQLALSCVTHAQITTHGHYGGGAETAWIISGDPALLPRTVGSSLRVRLSQKFRVSRVEAQPGSWHVTITAYHYTLEESDGREIISFQWHPTGRGALPYPHLHLGAAAGVRHAEIAGVHIPSGRLAMEQVLRFAIETLKVQPRRSEWRDVLFFTRRRFEQWRPWE